MKNLFVTLAALILLASCDFDGSGILDNVSFDMPRFADSWSIVLDQNDFSEPTNESGYFTMKFNNDDPVIEELFNIKLSGNPINNIFVEVEKEDNNREEYRFFEVQVIDIRKEYFRNRDICIVTFLPQKKG